MALPQLAKCPKSIATDLQIVRTRLSCLLLERVQHVDRFGTRRQVEHSVCAVGNCSRLNALAQEVARHQQVDGRTTFAFDFRRLHQPSRSIQAKVAHRSLGEGGLTQSVTRYGWQANLSR
jgi:hypothetical protein